MKDNALFSIKDFKNRGLSQEIVKQVYMFSRIYKFNSGIFNKFIY